MWMKSADRTVGFSLIRGTIGGKGIRFVYEIGIGFGKTAEKSGGAIAESQVGFGRSVAAGVVGAACCKQSAFRP